MPTLYVIRHAEPESTAVLAGQSDPALSVRGRIDASRLNVSCCSVYCSPLRRALETASFINSSPIIVDDLAEISYGEWDGLTWTEIERRWPSEARAKLVDWQAVVPPGGEPWGRFATRVDGALTEILSFSSPAVIVAHEAVNAIIDHYFNNSRINEFRQSYCEVRQYRF